MTWPYWLAGLLLALAALLLPWLAHRDSSASPEPAVMVD